MPIPRLIPSPELGISDFESDSGTKDHFYNKIGTFLHFLKGKNSNNCMNKIWSQNFDSGSDSETGRV